MRDELATECNFVRETERVLQRMYSYVPSTLPTSDGGGSEFISQPSAHLSPKRAAAAVATEAAQADADASARAEASASACAASVATAAAARLGLRWADG